jgi:hypothetical protein
MNFTEELLDRRTKYKLAAQRAERIIVRGALCNRSEMRQNLTLQKCCFEVGLQEDLSKFDQGRLSTLTQSRGEACDRA